jgi:hypothetical protein
VQEHRGAATPIRAAVSPSVVGLISDWQSWFRSRVAITAENRFLRTQLGFYQEHKVNARALCDAGPWDLCFGRDVLTGPEHLPVM